MRKTVPMALRLSSRWVPELVKFTGLLVVHMQARIMLTTEHTSVSTDWKNGWKRTNPLLLTKSTSPTLALYVLTEARKGFADDYYKKYNRAVSSWRQIVECVIKRFKLLGVVGDKNGWRHFDRDRWPYIVVAAHLTNIDIALNPVYVVHPHE